MPNVGPDGEKPTDIMPKLVIDEQEIEVPAGTKVIEAAERLGIMIPRFCYHPALGAVGACRVCAVKFLQGPVKGLQMSCMIDAKDGMVVSTTDEEAVDFRRHVIEWLMLHHPHDCPVCDEGGHCLLQDMTVSGGHGRRRYLGKKRTYADQNLGPLVQHEMNRCIHCYRCSRFYQEFSGFNDLGPLQIGHRTYFGRFRDGTLQSPFSGNLSDICPTGVYTDKPSRFKGRRWDYERTPSLCLHCGLGCHITVSARYREIVRHEARFSENINGHFICDRGRFGFYYTEDESRPRRAHAGGQPLATEGALLAAVERLAAITASAGPAAIACAGGRRSSLETLHTLTQVSRTNGWRGPSFFSHREQAVGVATAVARWEAGLAVSLREIEDADVILTVGADPLNEAPMLALAMRQAHRKGAGVVVLDPRPVSLPFGFAHLPARPGEMVRCLGAILKDSVAVQSLKSISVPGLDFYRNLPSAADFADPLQRSIAETAHRLNGARRPIIVCGTAVTGEFAAALAADGALLLQAAGKEAGLFYLLPGPNAFGAALLADLSFDGILADIESGAVKALIVVEWDAISEYPDRPRLERALEKLELLMVLDCLDSATGQAADVRLPTTTVYESGGLFINQEGRLQAAPAVYRGGRSIRQDGRGSHPPRQYSSEIPGTGPWPAWRLMAELARGGPAPKAAPEDGRPSAEVLLPLAGLPPATRIPADGLRVGLVNDPARRFNVIEWGDAAAAPGLELLVVDWTFGTDELSVKSPPLQQLERPPCLSMHTADATGLNLRDGDRVTLATDQGELTVALRVTENMAKGVLVLPRHHRLNWQILGAASDRIQANRISKAHE
jgi:NADH-quinone oxidoreductase subunit G